MSNVQIDTKRNATFITNITNEILNPKKVIVVEDNFLLNDFNNNSNGNNSVEHTHINSGENLLVVTNSKMNNGGDMSDKVNGSEETVTASSTSASTSASRAVKDNVQNESDASTGGSSSV
eukprot:Pgem_evm1s11941